MTYSSKGSIPAPHNGAVVDEPLPVIHGSVNEEGSFFFWGEGPFVPIQKKRGRKPTQPKPQRHPFALSPATLKKIAGKFPGNPALFYEGETTLWLPTTDRGPDPSPELYKNRSPVEHGARVLAPWSVATMSAPIASVIPLFLQGVEDTDDARYGASIQAWSVVALFAGELVVKGSIVPGFRPVGKNTITGMWRPELRYEDTRRLNELAAAMPPLVRAHFNHDGQEDSPRLPVWRFIDEAVQAFVTGSYIDKGRKNKVKEKERDSPAEEVWYRSLKGEDLTIADNSPVLRELKTWLAGPPLAKKQERCNTCFTVQEPADEESAWRVGFFLQSKDDPTLLVPASEVWSGQPGKTAHQVTPESGFSQERMLYDLGAAAKIYPPIRDALKKARPQGIILPPEKVYSFLTETAPILGEIGCTVLLPSWWKHGRQHPSVRMEFKEKPVPKGGRKGSFSLDTVLSFDWKVAIGDEELSPLEFEELSKRKLPLMKVRGRWVIFDPDEVQRVIHAFKKEYPDQEITLSDALALNLGGQGDEKLPLSGVTSEGPLREFMDRLVFAEVPGAITLPKTFTGTLRPYQEKGVAWLSMLAGSGMGACLADDMGLGKTVQVIAHLAIGKKNGKGKKKTLLVCPMSIIGNWMRELRRFAPSIRVHLHHGSKRCSGEEFDRQREESDLVITSYQMVQRDEELLSAGHWDCVVLDEAQNIKNHATKQARAVRKLRSSSRIVLTGTPVENRLFELWSIMEFLNPGYLGTAASFQKQFSIPIERHHDTERALTLKKIIRPFLLRRVKTDRQIITDLPDKMIFREFCPLTKEQVTLYDAAVKEMLERLDSLEGIARRGAVLVTLMRLKQICNHPALFLNDGSDLLARSGKVERLCEVLEEVLTNDERSLIFTQFSSFGEMLKPYLERIFSTEVLFLHGGTKREARDEMVMRFSQESGPKIFILSLKAGGTGLNLTAANHVFHIDRWWNPAVEDQATDRAFRIGQSRNVEVHLMMSAGTLEEKIDAALEEKRALAGSIIGTGEDWISGLSTGELRELLALRKEALEDDLP